MSILVLCSSCLVMAERLFLAVTWGCLRFVIVVFPDHTHYFLWFLNTEQWLNVLFNSMNFHPNVMYRKDVAYTNRPRRKLEEMYKQQLVVRQDIAPQWGVKIYENLVKYVYNNQVMKIDELLTDRQTVRLT